MNTAAKNAVGNELSEDQMTKEINKGGVSSNPSLVEFPQDVWGFTSKLRKVGLSTAGSIRGNEAKLKQFMQTLQIIAEHAKARFPVDKATLERNLEENAKRDAANRQIESTKPKE